MAEERLEILNITDTLKPFELFTGDTKNLIAQFLDDSDVPIDISTKTASLFRVTVRQDEASAVLFTITGAFVTDGTDGQVQFTFGPTETAAVLEEGIVEMADNNSGVKLTVFKRVLNIFRSIQ